MANVQHKKKSTLIGVRDVVFCLLKKDDATGVQYDASVHSAPGVIEIGLTPNVSSEQLAADDNPAFEMMSAFDTLDVSFTVNALDKELSALLLGHTVDSNGVLIEASDDVAPYVAMGFKSAKSDGTDKYIWLYKGKFTPSDQTFRTKEQGTVNWNTPALSATFGPRDNDKRMKADIDTSDEGVSATTVSSFFATVYTPATA